MNVPLWIEVRLTVHIPVFRRREIVGVLAVLSSEVNDILFANVPGMRFLAGVLGSDKPALQIVERGAFTDGGTAPCS